MTRARLAWPEARSFANGERVGVEIEGKVIGASIAADGTVSIDDPMALPPHLRADVFTIEPQPATIQIPVLSRAEARTIFDAPANPDAVSLTRESFREVTDKMRATPPDAQWCIRYHLAGNPGATTPEPAEGAMHDRGVLIGLGATNIEVVEVKA